MSMGVNRHTVLKHLALIGLYFRYNLAATLEYRKSFWVQTFGMVVNNASFIIFWSLVYARIPSVAGYGFREVMFVWALTSAAFGFAHLLFGNIRQLSRIILQGDLDTYLLQPKDVYLNVAASRMEVSAWGDLAYGIVLYIIMEGFQPGRLLLFATFVLMSGLLMGCVFLSAESLTFFTGNATAIGRLLTEFLINFSIYPEGIFQGWVRWLIYSLIPAGFIVFVPLRIMRFFSWRALLMLAGIDLCYILGSYLLFRIGLRRYESGNLIGTRL